jgi:hypothetical protein
MKPHWDEVTDSNPGPSTTIPMQNKKCKAILESSDD